MEELTRSDHVYIEKMRGVGCLTERVETAQVMGPLRRSEDQRGQGRADGVLAPWPREWQEQTSRGDRNSLVRSWGS